MRCLATALLALVLMATPAASQEIPVRSGDHEGFTRLVFRIPPDTVWRLSHRDRGAGLTVDLPNAVFSTDGVFDRISRSRLKSLRQAKPGASLEMTFACDCTATGFLYAPDMIVVDIGPAPVPAAPPVIPLPAADELLRAAASSDGSARSGADDLLSFPQGGLPVSPHSLPLAAIEQQLLSQIVKNADREVVDLDIAEVGPRRSLVLGNSAMRPPLPDLRNIAVGSVLDEARGGAAARKPLQERRRACISDQELDFANWSDGSSFSEQVSTARRALFQEFDRLDRAAALQLARTYAYFGFGSEAIRVLSLMDPPAEGARQIWAIAAAIEGRAQIADNPFSGMQHCEGNASLWAVLTTGEIEGRVSPGPVEQAFARLPDHLKGHFGPDLSRIMTRAGHSEAARRILRSVARSGSDRRSEVALAEAELAAASGDTETEEHRLTEVVTAQAAPAEAPLALARLVEKRWSERGAISESELELAESFAQEYRQSEIGQEMALAHALALALGQEFDRASDRLALLAETGRAPEWTRTADRVAVLLAERADDITFLAHVTQPGPEITAALSAPTAIAISDRLTSLGFPSLALTFTARPGNRHLPPAGKLARARAALASGRPRQTELELATMDTEEALRLRAQAASEIGEFRAAAEHLLQIDDPHSAARNLWLAGAWEEAAQTVNTRYGAIARLSRDLSADLERPPTTPLAHAEYLLENSSRTRDSIAEMLHALEQGAEGS